MTTRNLPVSAPVPIPSLADLEAAASPAPWRMAIDARESCTEVELWDAHNDLIFAFSDDPDQVEQLLANLTWIVATRNAAAACRSGGTL